ncbi:MAG: glycoside hydrolase 100 family protein [Gammaproteobacteria bacterium]|nr:glycoside hydrolase 100 family protein [Gammaproteobacteria bacterium]
MTKTILKTAYQILEKSILYHKGEPIGTVAALSSPDLAAANYEECFIRDFVPSALVFLSDGRTDIVRNFLKTVLTLRTRERTVAGHEIQPGVMPASFRVTETDEGEILQADFGEKAIGRVAPVDSMMWWVILLYIYTESTGDKELAKSEEFQSTLRQILHLCLKDSFEVSPALLVPDACTMIDRRMGIYGHPLEIQSLFYAVLRVTHHLLDKQPTRRQGETDILDTAISRQSALQNYVRIFYWLDMERLNEIHRYTTEQFGTDSVNVLNIYPESIPNWVTDWLPDQCGYLVGNIGPSRMDFRLFTLGNLIAVMFGLATDVQSEKIIRLYESRWDDLIGSMPVKIIYPAMEGLEWQVRTGSDPKNVPWSYQNGGNWPALLWPFVAAALKTGRGDLAERAFQVAISRLSFDNWPEYYDSKTGRLIGRRANMQQVWSATSVILSHKLLEDPELLKLLPK